jgi:hypothetical protein|tara:strand:- start:1158 stop:1478 length:321 start_codon:yes stop_codon:yes gene_type:complete
MKEETAKRKITSIEISYSNKRELKELSNKEEFRGIIMRDSFRAIKDAIKNNYTTIELFNIINLSIIIKLSSLYFPTALKRISNYFEENEEYEKCAEIKQLINKIKQ